jgi:hypothetical protein
MARRATFHQIAYKISLNARSAGIVQVRVGHYERQNAVRIRSAMTGKMKQKKITLSGLLKKVLHPHLNGPGVLIDKFLHGEITDNSV